MPANTVNRSMGWSLVKSWSDLTDNPPRARIGRTVAATVKTSNGLPEPGLIRAFIRAAVENTSNGPPRSRTSISSKT